MQIQDEEGKVLTWKQKMGEFGDGRGKIKGSICKHI